MSVQLAAEAPHHILNSMLGAPSESPRSPELLFRTVHEKSKMEKGHGNQRVGS